MGLTKQDLLATPDVWTGDVPGVGSISLSQATGEDFDFIRGPGAVIDERAMLARIAVCVLVDDEGKPMFKRGELAQANKIPFAKLKAIGGAAKEHCGISDQDTDELSGNSETTTTDDSGTG